MFVAATAIFVATARVWPDAPQGDVDAIIGFWFVALLVFATGMSPAQKPLSVRAPLRIGFDSVAIRAESNPKTEKARRRRRPPVRTELFWRDVQEIRSYPLTWGPSNGVLFILKSGDQTLLGPISPELASQVMDTGRRLGLPVSD